MRMPQTEIIAAEFTVEFYSSETNEWRETVISHSLGFSFTTYALSPSVAHIRIVYWLDYRGILIGVDPFNNVNTTIDTTANSGEIVDNNELCRFIEYQKPKSRHSMFPCLGVCVKGV